MLQVSLSNSLPVLYRRTDFFAELKVAYCLFRSDRERLVLVHAVYKHFQFAFQRFDRVYHHFLNDIFLHLSRRFNMVLTGFAVDGNLLCHEITFNGELFVFDIK